MQSHIAHSRRCEKSILIIVQNLPVPFDRRVWQEATTLRQAGYQVAVICPKKKIYKKGYERLEEIDIYRYPLIYEADGGVIGYFVEFVYCWLATLACALRAYARRRFDVIHACNPPDTFFALAMLFRPFGVKFVFDHHDLSPEMYVAKGRPRRGLLYRGLLFLERCTLRSAELVIAVNESHKEIAIRRGDVDPSKVVIVRSGPRVTWAGIHDPDPSLKLGRKYLVVYLGEMCAQDGVDYLLRSVRHYADRYPDDTSFVLIGGGPDRLRLQQLAREMGIDSIVQFTGRVPDEVLWTHFSTADLCVDPDPFTEWSNLSTMNKIIEYMAFGRPIVAFDLLEHRRSASEAAVYVEPNDELKFATEVRKLIEDEERRARMAAYGRKRFVERLAWDNSRKHLLDAYDRLLGVEISGVAASDENKELISEDVH